jgi:hypothetical protein
MYTTQTDISDYQNPNFNGTGSTAVVIAPITLIHEYSTTEFYIGISINGADTGTAHWSIRKISKTGTVWMVTQYPNGNQNFNFIWDERLLYTYL